jgi:hypothetical protein
MNEPVFDALPEGPTEDLAVPVDWGLMAVESQARALQQLRTLEPGDVRAAINHLLILYRQSGEPGTDWALAYTDLDIRQGLLGDLVLTLYYQPQTFQAHVAEVATGYVVAELERVGKAPPPTSEQPDTWLMEVFILDELPDGEAPPRAALADVRARNSATLSRLEEHLAEYFALDDEHAQLNPVVQLILTMLTYYMDGEFVVMGLDRNDEQLQLQLRHNAERAGMDIYIDMAAIGAQFTKMVSEAP